MVSGFRGFGFKLRFRDLGFSFKSFRCYLQALVGGAGRGGGGLELRFRGLLPEPHVFKARNTLWSSWLALRLEVIWWP